VERSTPSPGVVKIDVLKRSNVKSDTECAIDELLKLELEIALAPLAPAEKTEFAYGHHCGSLQTVRRCRSILEHCVNRGDPLERHEPR
jgi:hypothetical protein